MNIEPWLADILVCPDCRERVELRHRASGQEFLVCSAKCRAEFDITSGIPVLLPASLQ